MTRKANVRARLKKVDAVIEAVRASGIECASLVCIGVKRYGWSINLLSPTGSRTRTPQRARNASQGQIYSV